MDDLERLGDRWLTAFMRRDYDDLEAMLEPDVPFLALIPRGLREETGPRAAIDAIREWFEDCDVTEFRSTDVDVLEDRVRIHYRADVREEGIWYTVDQTLIGFPGGVGFERVHLVCSGFPKIDARQISSRASGAPTPRRGAGTTSRSRRCRR